MKDSRSGIRYRLFDSDGLPWASRLDWPWLFLLSLLTAFLGAVLLGVYLGIWIRGKGRSALPLWIYSTLALAYVACFAISLTPHPAVADEIALCGFALWFLGAFTLRREVIRYYSEREGIVFKISPLLTALFSVWYICGLLRADYPLDETGKVPSGVLRLTF